MVQGITGNNNSIWTPEIKAKFQEEKPSTPPWTRPHGLNAAVQAHTITKTTIQRQPLYEHSSKEFEIPALAFIKVHTSRFSLALFMMSLQSLSTSW